MDKYPRTDMSDVIDHLSKLRGLQKEDLTEEAMLRSRIDQQSDVISVLKQRADEYLTKYVNQEKDIETYKRTEADLKEALNQEKQMSSLIQERFYVLDSNHTEMIKLKDDYKRQNDELLKANAELLNENRSLFSDELGKMEKDVHKLRAELKEAKELKDASIQRERDLISNMKQNKESFNLRLEELRSKREKETSGLRESIAGLTIERDTAVKELSNCDSRIKQVDKENMDLKHTLKNTQSLVEVKDTEIKLLRSKLDAEVRRSKESSDRFRKEVEDLAANVQVRNLRGQLEELQCTLDSKIKEYEAYKTHSSNLLKKEKDLNIKLRRLHVPGI